VTCLHLSFCLIAVCAWNPRAIAETISFTGNLRTDATFTACGSGCTLGPSNSDGDYAQWAAVSYTFNVPVTSSMTASTFSYGGGVNGAGAKIFQGGLEPYLSLFGSGGNFLGSTLFGITCPVGAKTNTDSGQCYDVELDGGALSPGTYEIALSAFENMSYAENPGSSLLSDGFTGLGNLAAGEDMHYAFDVTLTSTVPTPEPRTMAVMLLVVGIFFFKTLRRNRV
jgi:hypothetical protein